MGDKLKIVLSILLITLIVLIIILLFVVIQKRHVSNNILKIQDDYITVTSAHKKYYQEIFDKRYIDDNEIKLGIYTKKGNNYNLLKNIESKWIPEEIMCMLYIIPTQEENVTSTSFDKTWKNYWSKYTNIGYKIGYRISFQLNNGEIISENILDPDDAYAMFPKLQFYLYDDINLIYGKRYYHVLQEEVNENTKYSSIKIVGDKETKYIATSIKIDVFSYNNQDDFDPITKIYRGNSIYSVNLSNI